MLAAQLLREFEAFTSTAQAKKNIVAAVEQVAKKLGNTKAVCRKCYIHPAVFDAYLDGSMLETIAQRARKVSRAVDRLTEMEALGARTAAAAPAAGEGGGARKVYRRAEVDAAVGAFEADRRSAAVQPRFEPARGSTPSSRAAARRCRCRHW